MSRDHYHAINRLDGEPHPVDEAITRMLPQRALRRNIRTAMKALVQALGRNRKLWLELEELQVQFRIEREEAYFNLGYEYGAAAPRIQRALEEGSKHPPAGQ